MKFVFCVAAAVMSLLTGCASGAIGSAGTVFHTASGETFTAATAPEYKNGRYQFVDAAGNRQSLYLSQVTKVSER